MFTGVDPLVDRGHVTPTFEVEGTPCVLSPTFGVDIFCTNAHSFHWMIAAIFLEFSQLILTKSY